LDYTPLSLPVVAVHCSSGVFEYDFPVGFEELLYDSFFIEYTIALDHYTLPVMRRYP
jgi:hypothetical protein